jgi:hypothetical protein
VTGVLRARVAGAWVDIGSIDEVVVAPDDPITTVPTAELWYDTDDEPAAADTANFWNSAWGTVAISPTWQLAITDGSYVDVGATVVNLLDGRQYMFHITNSNSFGSTVGDVFMWRPNINGIPIAGSYGGAKYWVIDQGSGVAYLPSSTTEIPFTTTAGSKTLAVTIARTGGTGTGTQRGYFTIEDVGPVTKAAVNPPVGQPTIAAAGNALGIVAVGTLAGANPTTLTANTQVMVTGNLNFTMLTGRRYRVVLYLRAVASNVAATTSTALIRLRDGTTVLPATAGQPLVLLPAPGLYNIVNQQWVFDGDNVARVWNVTLEAVTNAGSAWTDTVGAFYIEDVGPNSTPALPIPETAPGWTPLTLTDGWVANAPETPGYRKIGDVVSLRGAAIRAAGDFTNLIVSTLPVGFRPPFFVRCAMGVFQAGVGGSYVVRATVFQTGEIALSETSTGWNTGWSPVLSLANISFSVTP